MSADDGDSPYFDDSRRLTGPNLFFRTTGSILEARGAEAKNPEAHGHWRQLARVMCAALEWCDVELISHVHSAITSLVISAPLDQLFTATEVNEWAWLSTVAKFNPELNISNATADRPNDVGDIATAMARLSKESAEEHNPPLMDLAAAAAKHQRTLLVDEEMVSIGGGVGSVSYPLDALPPADQIDWAKVREIPTGLVTGSNGKTTTVRLIAAIARASQLSPGYSCTEGVFVDGEQLAAGDYSGPAGARTVLRDLRVDCAILETARGGMLRRGLAITHARVAVVTNVSADHFGEYGVDSLEDLADAKLIVAKSLDERGTLVTNADDPVLVRRSEYLWSKLALFAGDYQHALLQKKRQQGGRVCGVENGKLKLFHHQIEHDLGEIDAMPLTVNGSAAYNIANISAAVLAASVLGFSPTIVARVLSTFGRTRFDNPGRLERWEIHGVQIFVDYAHNPAGLAGLLTVANRMRTPMAGRLGLLLGQAGNREDEDIEALAKTAASFTPDLILLKDIDGMLRGREAGEVPAMLRTALLAAGVKCNQIAIGESELEAAKQLVTWAKPGDAVVLPMHNVEARSSMHTWLDTRAAS